MVVLDKNLREWKQLCGKAWEIDNEYLQQDRFAKIREGRYTIGKCNKITIECTAPDEAFLKTINVVFS